MKPNTASHTSRPVYLRVLCCLCTLFTAVAVASAGVAATAGGGEPEAVNIVYYEDFDGCGDTYTSPDTAAALGWTVLGTSDGTACRDNSTLYSIKDGRLILNNYKDVEGADSYIRILTTEDMAETSAGDYTVQYDITLDAAKDTSRYITVLTDYTENTQGTYNSFHLRIRGSANNQARVGGKWLTYDAAGDYYAADTDDSDGTSTVLSKITGLNYDNSYALAGVDLTIRYVEPADGSGPTVYIRNNTAGGDFVKVSEPSEKGDAVPFWHSAESMPGRAVVLKTGGAVDGSIDNIIVYTGTGEPVFEVVTEEPETSDDTTAAGQTGDGSGSGRLSAWEFVKLYGGYLVLAVVFAAALAAATTRTRHEKM